jgi:hypothetical protein
MPINLNKPSRWKSDIEISVDRFNEWFLSFAPPSFREARQAAIIEVEETFQASLDFLSLDIQLIRENPKVLSILRMSTAPPLARDRLSGLSGTARTLVNDLEDGKRPGTRSEEEIKKILRVIKRLLDSDVFPWLSAKRKPSTTERLRAATIIADRRCSAASNPIIRNEQEKRQLALIETYLLAKGYHRITQSAQKELRAMESGTYAIRMTVHGGARRAPTNIPVDVVVQPLRPKRDRFPLLIEAKSAGDFANVNKRRKEEAQKFNQLKAFHGSGIRLALFLSGYFNTTYLGYSAAEGIDWVWDHRIVDFDKFGL